MLHLQLDIWSESYHKGGGGSIPHFCLGKAKHCLTKRTKKSDDGNLWILSSINEENSGAGQSGQGVGHLADSGIVDESAEEEQEA